MTARSDRVVLAVFLLVVAPIGAVVVVAALLLYGVQPRTVFAPGFAMLALLARLGIHAPNSVGVITTTGLWWLVIAAAGALWDRRHR